MERIEDLPNGDLVNENLLSDEPLYPPIHLEGEDIEIVLSHGKRPYVFQSQNVDGFDNNAIYEHYKGRVKHF